MNTAKQFMEQLQEGKTTEAIKTIEEALKSRSAELIEEQKVDILESYGFVVSEKKHDMKEEESEEDDSEEEEMNEAKFYYAIQNKKTKDTLTIADSEDAAEEEIQGLKNSDDYKIVKITKSTKDNFEKRKGY